MKTLFSAKIVQALRYDVICMGLSEKTKTNGLSVENFPRVRIPEPTVATKHKNVKEPLSKKCCILLWGHLLIEWCDILIAGATGVNDEDFFVKERDWAALYHIHINDTRDKYQQVVSAKLKTSNQITHLSTLLKASVGGREGKFKTSEFHQPFKERVK